MDLAKFFSLGNWPVLLLSALLIVAAAIDWWKLKVPNWLTYPMIFSGWILALLGLAVRPYFDNFNWLEPHPGFVALAWSDFLASVVLTFFGLALLLPIYAIGGMGAGDVKMTAGYGSWIGAIYSWNPGYKYVWWGFAIGVLVGGVIALGMMFWRGDFFQNRKNVSDIVRDWFGSSSVHEVASKAAERKSRMHLLPYGVPLCIGFISYMIYVGG